MMVRRLAPFLPLLLLALLAGCAWGPRPWLAPEFEAARNYEFGQNRATLAGIEQQIRAIAPHDFASRRRMERQLVALLDSRATFQAKQFACAQLALVGGDAAVPALAGLLSDRRLHDAARQALERIPGDAAAAALRSGWWRLNNLQLVGVINSLGARRDAAAVPRIARRLGRRDWRIDVAAAAALGQIGGPAAESALLRQLERYSRRPPRVAPVARERALLNALLDVADARAAAGRARHAAEIYDMLFTRAQALARQATTEGQLARVRPIEVAALRGYARVRGPELLPLLLEGLDGSGALRQAAIQLMREMPGAEVDASLAAALAGRPPDARLALLDVLASRAARVAPPANRQAEPAVLAQLGEASGVAAADSLAVAAIQALAAIGGPQSIRPLALAAADASRPASRDAAREALAALRGADVDREAIALLADGQFPPRAEIVRMLGARRASASAAPLLATLAAADGALRLESIRALAQVAGPPELPALVAALRATRDPAEFGELEKALVAAARRSEDQAARVAPIAAGLSAERDARVRAALLRALGRLGGAPALVPLAAAASDPREPAREPALRALAEFPADDAAPALLRLAESDSSRTLRTLALRGYLRLAEARLDRRPTSASLAMLRAALRVDPPADEQIRVLGLASRLPDAGALELVLPLRDRPAVAAEADLAVLSLLPPLAPFDPARATRLFALVRDGASSATLAARIAETSATLARVGNMIVAWQMNGPWPRAKSTDPADDNIEDVIKHPFAPERALAGQAQADPGDWRPLPVRPNAIHPGVVDLADWRFQDLAVMYLRARVWSPRAQPALLLLGSDDGVTAWLNGRRVHEIIIGRAARPDEDRVPVELREGWNELMLKIHNNGGDWMAYARLNAPDGAPFEGLRIDAAN